MLQEVTLENELNRIVYSKVHKGSYSPIPLVSDREVKEEIYKLKSEKVQRPPTKQEYFALLDKLNKQVADIAILNGEITAQNIAGQKAVDDKYVADIAAAKLDEKNIGEALCICINHQLNNTEWYVVKDNGLLESQQVKAEAWRTAQMNIVYEEPTIMDAVAKYDTLIATKPKYDLEWKVEPVEPIEEPIEAQIGATPGATPGWEIT